MAGKSKYADRMATHLGEAVEAACPITRTGGTASQIGSTVGGVVGAGIHGRGGNSDVDIGQFAWLGLGADHFTLTSSSFSGKPTGDPLAQVAYRDVTSAEVSDGKITARVDLDLEDGRHIAFEVKRQGPNKKICIPVIELLRDRCTTA